MMNYHQFYKFRVFNKYFIDSLVKGYLYFASPSQLNDPFDCQIDIGKILLKIATQKTNNKSTVLKEFSKLETTLLDMQNGINTFGICSFSLDNMETLMWSHYANDHKGACVMYSFPEPFLVDEENRNNIFGVAKVAYDSNPVTNWIKTMTTAKLYRMDVFYQEFTSLLLTQKSPSWQYEREVRIVRTKTGPLKIHSSFIKQICFGLQTSEEDIELITKIAGEISSDIEFCRIIRGDDDFGLKLIKI